MFDKNRRVSQGFPTGSLHGKRKERSSSQNKKIQLSSIFFASFYVIFAILYLRKFLRIRRVNFSDRQRSKIITLSVRNN